MQELRELADTERVILAAAALEGEEAALESLDELEALAETAGAQVVGRIVQYRDSIAPGSYFGRGKIEELAAMAQALEADSVIFDDELSPAMQRNLEKELPCRVVDRTVLILDIFAGRAFSAEGKIQVELAQLQYRMTRLAGSGTALSRLGGGIGTRGPGEKKLETDRRMIRTRISRLKAELKEIKKHRQLLQEGRAHHALPQAALVGYTNTGKSTLLHTLTGADVLRENKLFATLDPTTRKLVLPEGDEVLLTDTVGFIRKLPHHLVNAFRSTLETAGYSDILLHVVDSSSPQMEKQMAAVYDTLQMLGIQDKKIITVFNKSDLVPPSPVHLHDPQADRTIRLSAKTGEGIGKLLEAVSDCIHEDQILIERRFSYREAGKLDLIRRYGRLVKEEYLDEEIYVKAYVPEEIYGRV